MTTPTTLSDRLADPGYKNWVKASIAVDYLRDGLITFSDQNSQEFHNAIKATVGTKVGGPLLPCSCCHSRCTRRKCKEGHIYLHGATWKIKKGCASANNLCEILLDEIVRSHIFPVKNDIDQKSWKNSDVAQWLSSHWEVSKCYMNPGQRLNKGPSDSDLSALLNLALHNTAFHSKIKESIDPANLENNVFGKVRKARNDIMHSKHMQLTESAMKQCIQDMVDLVDSLTDLNLLEDAKQARVLLLQTLASDLMITETKEMESRINRLKALQEVLGNEHEDLKAKVDTACSTLEALTSEGGALENVKSLQKSSVEQLGKLEQKLNRGNNELKAELQFCNGVIQSNPLLHGGKLQQRFTDVGREMKCIDDNCESLSQEIAAFKTSVESRLVTLERSVSEHSVELEGLRTDFTSQKREMQHLESMVSSTAADVQHLQTRLLSHEEDLDPCKESLGKQDASSQCVESMETEQFEGETKDEPALCGLKRKRSDSETTLSADCIEFQKELVSVYRKTYCDVTVSPIFDDVNTQLDDVYTDLIVEQDDSSFTRWGQKRHGGRCRIKSYADIYGPYVKFCRRSNSEEANCQGDVNEAKKVNTNQRVYANKKPQTVYLVGKAGMGKTTWCYQMVKVWCSAVEQKQNGKQVSELTRDEKVMLDFHFVYFVSLKHVSSNLPIDQVITSAIFRENPDAHESVLFTLRTFPENVLLLLDGLDECRTGQAEALRLRKTFRNCCALITSRPWKLESLEIKPHEVDLVLDLQGFDLKCAEEYVRKIIPVLMKTSVTQFVTCPSDDRCDRVDPNMTVCKCCAFFRNLKSKHLEDLIQVPLMVLYLSNSWCFEKAIPLTSTKVLVQLISCLFQRAWRKSTKIEGVLPECQPEQSPDILPSICQSEKSLLHNAEDLVSLGRLALKGLINSSSDSGLVFTGADLVQELNPEGERKLERFLAVGLVSKSRVPSTLAYNINFCFVHRLVQEFLAALGMSVNSGKTSYNEFCDYCTSVDNVLQMANVVQFLCCMCPDLGVEFSQHVKKVCSEDMDILAYRRNCRKYVYKVQELTELLLDCTNDLLLTYPRENHQLLIADIDVEGTVHGENAVSSLVLPNLAKAKSLKLGMTLLDKHVTMKKILGELVLKDVEKMVVLADDKNGSLVPKSVTTLLKTMHIFFPALSMLGLSGALLPNEGNKLSVRNPGQVFIKQFCLEELKLTAPVTLRILELESRNLQDFQLDLKSMPHLSCLKLNEVDVAYTTWINFLQSLIQTNSLKTLSLCNCRIWPAMVFNIDLRQHEIENLVLGGLDCLGTAVFQTNAVQSFGLYQLPTDRMCQLLNSVAGFPNIRELFLGDDFFPLSDSEMKVVLNVLPKVHLVEKVFLWFSGFPVDQLPVRNLLRLKELGLGSQYIHQDSWDGLIGTLKSLSINEKQFHVLRVNYICMPAVENRDKLPFQISDDLFWYGMN